MNVTFETGGDGSTATTHDWLTPPEILEALGPFDMDPCASQFQPWRTAAQQFTIEDDGLAREWRGSGIAGYVVELANRRREATNDQLSLLA